MNGNALHLLRLAAGLSLEDLGEHTGIRPGKLARWETESPPRVGSDTYSRLADALVNRLPMTKSQIVEALLFGRTDERDSKLGYVLRQLEKQEERIRWLEEAIQLADGEGSFRRLAELLREIEKGRPEPIRLAYPFTWRSKSGGRR